MKKILLLCMTCLGLWATAQITVSEGFEGTTTPAGWVYTGFAKTTVTGYPCTGTAALRKNIYGTGANASANAVYSSTASNGNEVSVSFKYTARPFSITNPVVTGSMKVEYSVDGGTTYVALGTPVTFTAAVATCTVFSATIPAGTVPAAANFKFKITGTNSGTGDWYLTIDDVSINQTTTTPPSCTSITAPADASNNISVTPNISWSPAAGATNYTISLGTTPGSSDVLAPTSTGSATNYQVPATSPLNYNSSYYITVVPSNANGSATGCASTVFTTTATVPCPTVSVPATNAVNQTLTPTFTWAAVPNATSYTISIGTTSGGSDILSNFSVGNVTTYTYNGSTPLLGNTKYYYTINAVAGAFTSSSCGERNFTTLCTTTQSLPWTENFDAMTTLGDGILPTCWGQVVGSKPFVSMNASSVTQNAPKSAPNYVTMTYGNTNASQLWTPGFALEAGKSYDFSFYYNTNGTSSTFIGFTGETLVNTLPNGTGATNLGTFISSTEGTTGYTIKKVTFIPTTTGTYYFGVKVTSTFAPWYLGLDDFSVMETPPCSAPIPMSIANVTDTTATLNLTAPATVPANGYEYVYSTTNAAPTGAGTPITGTTVDLTGLTPNTQYYVWVRSMCAGINSTWESISFTTAPANDNCTSPVNLMVGAGVNDNPVVGTFVGATNTADTTATHTCQSSAYRDVWYAVTVPASGNVTIETQANGGSQVDDTVLTVYTGSCGALTQLVCNDDASSTVYFSKAVVSGQTPGTVLLVAVRNYSSTKNDSFKVSAYDSSLGTSEATAKNRISVYPNPFTDVIHLSNAREVKSVKVMDASGRLVSKFDNVSSELNLSKLSQGVYMIQVEGKDGSVNTIKAIKK